MNAALLALLALGGVALAVVSVSARGSEIAQRHWGIKSLMDQLDELFVGYAAQNGLDPLLLKAIASVESAMNPNAVRNNPPNDVSVGLMQVLCIPDSHGVCKNRFDVEGWEGMTFDALKDPATNINIASQILAWNLRQFGFPRGIAVYNAWNARHAPVDGPFPNQGYVDKVLRAYANLKGE